jgi:ubiquinone/menaquinone biosynthesis C-methylase UbiE
MEDSVIPQKSRFFDRWSFWYDNLFPTVFYQAVHQRMLEFVQLPQQARVLDIGCGTGRFLNRLTMRYPDVLGIGLDASPLMLKKARQSIQVRPRLIFIEGRSDRLPFAEGEFDAVFCSISFLHYPDPEAVFREIYRILKNTGVFYLADYLPGFVLSSWGRTGALGGGFSFYSKEERDRLGMQAGFELGEHISLVGPIILSKFKK